MRKSRFATAAAIGAAAALAFGGTAAGHHNPNPANACDTWNRASHGAPSHSHTGGENDQQVGPVYVHNHAGHYYVKADDSHYVEVVGGQGYNMNGSQGGYVQGAIFTPDGGNVNFHTHAFDNGKVRICVGAQNQKVDVDQ